jgi:hypothetical protein
MSPSEIIERHLAAFLAGPANEFTLIAGEHRALPVYSDIGGSLFITPSLEILAVDKAGHVSRLSEQAGQSRLIALVSAAEMYPDLQCLLPMQPENAVQCSLCEGRGWLLQPGMRCGECCGLGWQALHSNNSLGDDATKPRNSE